MAVIYKSTLNYLKGLGNAMFGRKNKKINPQIRIDFEDGSDFRGTRDFVKRALDYYCKDHAIDTGLRYK